MFDIGFSELLLIAVVALVVIGPERLPKVARTAGLLFGRLQRYVAGMRSEIERELRLDEIKRVAEEARTNFEDVSHSLQEGGQQVQEQLESVRQLTGTTTPGAPHATKGTPAVDGTHATKGTPAVDGTHATEGTPVVDGTHAAEGAHAVDGTHAVEGAHAEAVAPDAIFSHEAPIALENHPVQGELPLDAPTSSH